MRMSVRENSALASLKKFRSLGMLNRKKEVSEVHETLTNLSIKAPGLEAPVSALSGGNQQKVVMARALISNPLVILADEPTGQLDAHASAMVTELLVELAAESGGMLVVVTHAEAVAARVGTVRQLVDGRLEP